MGCREACELALGSSIRLNRVADGLGLGVGSKYAEPGSEASAVEVGEDILSSCGPAPGTTFGVGGRGT